MCPDISHTRVRKSQVGHVCLVVKYKVNVIEFIELMLCVEPEVL